MTTPLRVTADETARLISAASGRTLHLRFMHDEVTLHPDCKWPIPLLAEWRGAHFRDGAGI